MIPGYGSTRLAEETVEAAASIVVKADLIRVSGTTNIDTILSPILMGRDGALIFIYTPDAGVTITAEDNVAVSQALVTDRLYAYAYSHTRGKWIPHAVA